PLISQPLVPEAAAPGGTGFTLTVNGTGFVSGSVVHWNGAARTTHFVDQGRLTATIPATDIAKAGTASVAVVNPEPGGGTSGTVFFPIHAPMPSVSLARTDFSPTGVWNIYVVTADFNGDGKLDLATANETINKASVLLGNGDGTFESHVDYDTGADSRQVATGDFNGDGRLDLAVSSSDGVSILLGNGDGTFQSQTLYPLGTTDNPYLVIADLNGDGKLDLAVANTAGSVSILLGSGEV